MSCVTQYEQFSSSLSDACILQQVNIRRSLAQLAGIYSGYAASSGSQWPMVTLEKYEYYAGLARENSGLEMINIAVNVKEEDRVAFLNYTDKHYEEWVAESHRINPEYADAFAPTNYKNFISGVGFEEDVMRDEYFAIWTFSPPPVTYMTVNWNVASSPIFANQAKAGRALRDEAVITGVTSYIGIDRDSHAELHGDTDGEYVDHPHSFVWYPVHEEVGNAESTIVAFLSSATAWDTAMRDLIPEGVYGIHAVIRNSCGDVFTYEINGSRATFLGLVDAHDKAYDGMKVELDLALHTNPDYTTTPNHCMYYMVSFPGSCCSPLFFPRSLFFDFRLACQEIYPSASFESLYKSNVPEMFASVVAAAFFFIIFAYAFYDRIVEKRNKKREYSGILRLFFRI